jgi:hypothetical protein
VHPLDGRLAAAALVASLATPGPAQAGPGPELALFRRPGLNGASLVIATDQPRMHFAARSLEARGRWMLCPRPMYGGACIEVDGRVETLSLPRTFSGAVRSARLAEPAAAVRSGPRPPGEAAPPPNGKPPPAPPRH